MGKLINNSLVKSESHEVGSLLVAVILFALTGVLISHNLLAKYLVGSALIEPQVVWVEKTFFMTFMMSMMGIICAVVWNNLFLDKEDYDNLLTLPIKPGPGPMHQCPGIKIYFTMVNKISPPGG